MFSIEILRFLSPERLQIREKGEHTMLPKFNTIDEYLETVTGDRLKALERLRKSIRSIIPKSEECFSYGMPAFRLNGITVAGFGISARNAPDEGYTQTAHIIRAGKPVVMTSSDMSVVR